MRLARDLVLGITNSAWTAIASFIVVPIYLRCLGADAYGLIAFFTTIQAFIAILDLGLSATINREIAKSHTSEALNDARQLLHTFSYVYIAVALVIFVLLLVSSNVLSQQWLKSDNLSVDTIRHAVILIGLVIALRWPIALYQGALLGAHRLALQSSINMVMVTLSTLGAVLVLMFVSSTIEAYFLWQAFVGVLYFLTIKRFAWRELGVTRELRFDWVRLKSVWRFTLGMTGIGISSLAFTQLDKLILSKMLDLAMFAHYMLATMLVSSLYLIVIPIYNIIYPKFTHLLAKGAQVELIDFYFKGLRSLSSIVFPLAMILVLFSEAILTLWTGDVVVAKDTAPLVGILATGSALHCSMYFPYALQLASGKVKLAFLTNLVLMFLFAPVIVILTIQMGVRGAAFAWLAVQVVYFLMGSWLTSRYAIHEKRMPWISLDVLIPLLITTAVGFMVHYGLDVSSYNLTKQILTAAAILFFTLLVNVLSSAHMRELSCAHLKNFK